MLNVADTDAFFGTMPIASLMAWSWGPGGTQYPLWKLTPIGDGDQATLPARAAAIVNPTKKRRPVWVRPRCAHASTVAKKTPATTIDVRKKWMSYASLVAASVLTKSCGPEIRSTSGSSKASSATGQKTCA